MDADALTIQPRPADMPHNTRAVDATTGNGFPSIVYSAPPHDAGAGATDPVDLDAIRSYCAEASPAPWKVLHGDEGVYVMLDGDESDPEYSLDDDAGDVCRVRVDGPGANPDDATFIARARTDLPRLLEVVAQLTRERDQEREKRLDLAARHDRLIVQSAEFIDELRAERDELARQLEIKDDGIDGLSVTVSRQEQDLARSERAREELQKDKEREYVRGLKDGVTAYAWWKDGEQYVGTCGVTLRIALHRIDKEFPTAAPSTPGEEQANGPESSTLPPGPPPVPRTNRPRDFA